MKPQPFSIYCEKFALAITKLGLQSSSESGEWPDGATGHHTHRSDGYLALKSRLEIERAITFS
jgi:hypothetical protein